MVGAASEVPAGFRPAAVVLAIKPQEAQATLPSLSRFVAPGTVFLSIMAGQTVAGIRTGARRRRRRWCAPCRTRRPRCGRASPSPIPRPEVSPAQRALADALLASVGEVAWVEDEALLDPVTAVSGGGPAYVFLLAEVMEAAAIEQGLPPDLARRMARATVAGSGALLAASAEDAAALRRAVTSPKGTTERALEVLMAPEAWPALMSRAIKAATARSRELAG